MAKLTLSLANAAGTTTDLAALGTADFFIYPNSTTRTEKIDATDLAVAFIAGTSNPVAFNGSSSTSTWSGGAPTASGSSTGAIYFANTQQDKGVTITAPAGTGERTLRVIIGAYQTTAKVAASLSDGSAAAVEDVSTVYVSGNAIMRMATIVYSAASDGQTLTVNVTNNTAGGNISMQSAALTTAAAPATVPGTPTNVTATAGSQSASVTGTAPSDGGSPITGYRATATPGGATGTSATLPVTVTGLTDGTAYTLTLAAQNAVGYGPESAASNSVTPSSVNNAPTFSGTIPNISGTAGQAITPVNVSSYFTDGDALTYSASPSGTAWPSGLSIDSATGVISGTVASSGTTSGIRVRATDTASQSVDSNTFNAVMASGPVQVPISDANLLWSPYTWDDYGTHKSANATGAYVKMAFTGTSVTVKLDVSAMVAASVASGDYPIVRTIIDGYRSTDTTLTSASTGVTVSSLAAGAHTLEFVFLASKNSVDRWNGPTGAIRVTGFTINAGESVTAAAARAKRMIYFGDSITEGYFSLGTTTSTPAGNSALHTAVPNIAQALGVEYGQIGFGGQGYISTGQGNVPNLYSAMDLYSSGRSRLVGGVLSPAPDCVMVEHGANGYASLTQAQVQSSLTKLRTIAPTAKIFIMVPAGGFARAAITNAVAAQADANMHLIDLGSSYEPGINGTGGSNMWALDALHRNALSNARVASGYASKVQAVLDGVASPTLNARTVTLTLGDASGALANLAGLKVAFYDEPTPDLHTVPRFKADNVTTNASGVMTLAVQSTLASGGSGSVVIQMADGRNLVRTVAVS